ncbi:MAG: RagB/SusD family nutrient uptake outer membrane protein [Paludibacter sp.]
MKINNIKKYLIGIAIIIAFNACTDLSETVYDEIVVDNYYNTRDDIIRSAFRPFEQAYSSIRSRQVLCEEVADQIGTWERDGWWLDNQQYQYLHYHTWTSDHFNIEQEWRVCYQGIMQSNSVIEELAKLDPEDFNMSQSELDNYIAQNKTLRAWFYIRLLDMFRNIPLAVSLDDSKNSVGQVEPSEIFNFVEQELKQSIELLPVKSGAPGNGILEGQWTKAGAAALLVRLYLNAEKWIGTEKYTECATYAQQIIDGVYGNYGIDDTWDSPFDWNNDEVSKEIIFAFPSTFGRSHWLFDLDTYFGSLPADGEPYFGVYKDADFNCKYAAQPSLDLDGNDYSFTMGKPIAKFKKYPEDYRLKLYKNLGDNTREGMFVYGYLEYEEGGVTKNIKSPTDGNILYIRDQVGAFHDLAPGNLPADKKSSMVGGDHNSGWHFAKYPIYSDSESGKCESDYVEIRLPEIYYSLAECKFRNGDENGAGVLLNAVRKRNYPESTYSTYLYQPEGFVVLTEDELLDEWGREFFAEGRRRTDLIRWNKFCTESWWDKTPDADNHTEIFPIPRDYLGADHNLVQNPGYAY